MLESPSAWRVIKHEALVSTSNRNLFLECYNYLVESDNSTKQACILSMGLKEFKFFLKVFFSNIK